MTMEQKVNAKLRATARALQRRVVGATARRRPYGLLVIWGDVEPQPLRWFSTAEQRDGAARQYRARNGERSGLYRLDVAVDGRITVGAFSGGFFNVEV